MRRWFLSYHSPDQLLAERLKTAIEHKDVNSRVFFASTSLRAGGYWQPALAKEIDGADAFVLLVGESGLGPWQELEYYAAHDKHVNSPGFPVVLVLLERHAAPGLPFLRQLHWIVSADPTSEKDVARLIDAAAGADVRPGQLWRFTSPYRGLSAMEEKDAEYFFGRERETVEVLGVLAAEDDRLPVLLGNSGVGKSSLALAGVLAALKRQAWPRGTSSTATWPPAFRDSRAWCFLTLKPGGAPLKSLVEPFLQIWQFDPTDPRRETRRTEWIENLRDERNTLSGLLDATEGRLRERGQSKPPSFLLYVDQGEELYVRGEERQRRRFSEVIAQGVADPRLHMLMSMRADFLGELQKDEPLFKVHRQINVPPLREAELREVVSRPAELLSARFEIAGLADIITRRTAEDSVKDVGALPLLSYTLDDMWAQMVKRGDGVLRLPAQSFELGGVLVDRADAFLATHPKSQDELRRIFTLKLATVREGEEPTRRRALRSEFTNEEWRLVSELADHPNRLLVTATPEGAETYAEVAHEAMFRRWDKLRGWIAAEREFLGWKTGLEAARRAWQAAQEGSKNDALLMGAALTRAESWLRNRKRSGDIPVVDWNFIVLSRKAAQRRKLRVQALVGVQAFAILAAVIGIGWLNQDYLWEQVRQFVTIGRYVQKQVRPYVLNAAVERELKPGNSFRECAKDCPQMVIVPAGEFMMGSHPNERGRNSNEDPQHKVVFAKPFAVSKFEVTFDEWDTCVAYGDCKQQVSDNGFGRGLKPVINVTWEDARRYVAWLSRMTGKRYRLLSEAEWEYAARAGTQTAYSWGDEIGTRNANCTNCGSQLDVRQPAPVGSFPPNAFGLHDMHGNVWEWVEDCYNDNYDRVPADGSAWSTGDCSLRVVRGGSWNNLPERVRSAFRGTTGISWIDLGFRVGRTLTP